MQSAPAHFSTGWASGVRFKSVLGRVVAAIQSSGEHADSRRVAALLLASDDDFDLLFDPLPAMFFRSFQSPLHQVDFPLRGLAASRGLLLEGCSGCRSRTCFKQAIKTGADRWIDDVGFISSVVQWLCRYCSPVGRV